jgi:hypothetical protein
MHTENNSQELLDKQTRSAKYLELSSTLQVPFDRTLTPYLKDRTNGFVCLDCLCFFTRDSRDVTFHCSTNIIRTKDFVKTYNVTSLDSFIRAVELILSSGDKEGVVPSFGRQECSHRLLKAHKSLAMANLKVTIH